jgi:hypothetical protein
MQAFCRQMFSNYRQFACILPAIRKQKKYEQIFTAKIIKIFKITTK